MKYFLILFSFIFFSLSLFANQQLYQKCASCHGTDASKKALGVSNILKGQSKDELVKKMKGYKDGSYGGSKKSVMASQMKDLSDKDINDLADYISKLK
jgi:cytochrome c